MGVAHVRERVRHGRPRRAVKERRDASRARRRVVVLGPVTPHIVVARVALAEHVVRLVRGHGAGLCLVRGASQQQLLTGDGRHLWRRPRPVDRPLASRAASRSLAANVRACLVHSVAPKVRSSCVSVCLCGVCVFVFAFVSLSLSVSLCLSLSPSHSTALSLSLSLSLFRTLCATRATRPPFTPQTQNGRDADGGAAGAGAGCAARRGDPAPGKAQNEADERTTGGRACKVPLQRHCEHAA